MRNKLILFFLLICSFFVVNAEGEATLKNVKVNNIECKCIEYNCSIETEKSSAIITYELDDTNATVDRQSGFQIDLTSLTTTIKINVSNTYNDEKRENTYVITINKKEKNGDNTIKALMINGQNITLTPDIVVYPYTAKYDEVKITVKAEVNNPAAKIITPKEEFEFEFDMEKTSQSFDFVVEAENKETLTYRVFLTREEKPDTSLKSIKLDHGSILFDSKKYEYSFNVEYNINKINIDAVPTNSEATVKIENKDLIVGENSIKITVTNKKATSVYTLNVIREENIDKSIANLKSLEIKEYPKLDFEPNVLEYNLYFSEIPAFLNIKSEPIDKDAKIEIINNEDLIEDDKVVIKVTLNNITREYILNIFKKTVNGNNKTAVLIALIILIITIIWMLIIELKGKNKKNREMIKKIKEMNKKKEKTKKLNKKTIKKEKEKEEEIEII